MRNQCSVGFKLACPASADDGSPVKNIRARGNLALVLQEDMVIELKRSDLLESWRETCSLGRKRLDSLVALAAGRIGQALEDQDVADPASLASDATAFFLLAMRQQGFKATTANLDLEINFDSKNQIVIQKPH